jgi:hypothetical protein
MLLLSFSASSAQDRPWQVILCSGDTLAACRLDSLHDNVLNATCKIRAFSVPVDSIAALVQHKEGHFLIGAAIGTLMGAVAGAIIGAATYEKPKPEPKPGTLNLTFDWGPLAALVGGIIGAVGGFVCGGLIGSFSAGSETYDLKGKTLREKLYIIRGLLPK